MLIDIFLLCMLITAFAMVSSKRMSGLVNDFRIQSFFLFLLMLVIAIREANPELYFVAVLLFSVKVVAIPAFLRRIVKKIGSSEDLGLFLNPAVSIFAAIILTYLAYIFTSNLISIQGKLENTAFFVALAIAMIGIFIMIFRMKALAQMVGLLVMENGIFLAAASVSGGMPFFVEIAVFFDVFLCVIILEIFVYRINSLFTHIDVNKLTELKG